MNELITSGDIVAKLEKKSDITPELVENSIRKMIKETNGSKMIERKNLQWKRLREILDQYYIYPIDSL